MTDSNNSENKDATTTANNVNKNETGYAKILVTAIFTALLTSITQYFLQNSKLSGEQEYWNKRYNIESIDKINTHRLRLIDDINKELLQLEIKAKEIKLNAAASRYFTSAEQTKELTELLVQYHKDLYMNAAKVQMASFYFGNEVDSLIPLLGKALELNFQNNLLIKKSIKQNKVELPEFNLDFETLDTLTKSKNSLIKAMIEEISKSYENKNK